MELKEIQSAEPWADFTDEDLRRMQQESASSYRPDNAAPDEIPEEYRKWQYAIYDWSKFDPQDFDWLPIILGSQEPGKKGRPRSRWSGIFFTAVSPHRYQLLTAEGAQWYPLVHRYKDENGEMTDVVKRIYAYRAVGPKTRRKVLTMHRVIAEAEGKQVGDHITGQTLDQRDCNLQGVSRHLNNHNRELARRVYTELLPGLEWRNRSRTLVGARFRIITDKGEEVIRSEPWPFEEQHLAHQWLLDECEKRLGHRKTEIRRLVPPMVFPPLKTPAPCSFMAGSVVSDIAATF